MRVVIAASVAVLIAASPAAAARAAVLQTSRALRCLVYARPHMTVTQSTHQNTERLREKQQIEYTFMGIGNCI